MSDECNILDAETDFGLRLLAKLDSSDGSKIFSPISISLALALVHAGAKGVSREQIEQVLIGTEAFAEYFSTAISEIREAKGVEANIANRVFANEKFQINPEYVENVEKLYKAVAENVDFENAENAAATINKYVKDQTSGKVDELVSAEMVKNAAALLVNALYFNADWLEKFEKHNTIEREFHAKEGDARQVPFLNEFMTHRDFTEDNTFQVLSLPYVDPAFTFAIFLPKQRFGLEKALEKLTGSYFQSLLENLRNSYVNVHIPKMRIEKETSLKEPLEAVGITEIFSESADLSGIAKGLKISSGVHKAMIEVDEEGTTAAATSAFKATLEMMIMAEPTDFTADHPFLFALLHNKRPLFLGIHV